MNKNLLDLIESNILSIGEEISKLFDCIDDKFENGTYDEIEDNTFNLNKIIEKISTTREEMHKQVDEIYSHKEYIFNNEEYNDYIEREKEINIVLNKEIIEDNLRHGGNINK